MKRLAFTLIVAAFIRPLSADTFTLSQCIDSALQNNISLQNQRNQYATQRLSYNQQKQNLLPSVSGNVGQSWSFGRATGADNVTITQNMANTSFGVSANLMLFDGLGMKYRIDEARATMQANEAETEKLEADIRMNISTMYLQVLLNKELLAVADTQLQTTLFSLNRSRELVNEGRLAEGEFFTLQAQYAREELSKTQAANNLQLSLLNLAQAMNIYQPIESFDIVTPEPAELDDSLLPTNNEVYALALQNRPEIKAAQAKIRAQENAVRGAKSAYSPSLSASASFGTGYYHNYGGTNDDFATQLGNNLSTRVGLNLSIPIFDRMQTPNNVSRQKIMLDNMQLQIESTKQTLRKEIDQAYYNATAAQAQKLSAQKAVNSAQEALRYAQQKYEAGRASAYEYNNAKNSYVQASSQYLQAKYDFIFKLKILKYYQGLL